MVRSYYMCMEKQGGGRTSFLFACLGERWLPGVIRRKVEATLKGAVLQGSIRRLGHSSDGGWETVNPQAVASRAGGRAGGAVPWSLAGVVCVGWSPW